MKAKEIRAHLHSHLSYIGIVNSTCSSTAALTHQLLLKCFDLVIQLADLTRLLILHCLHLSNKCVSPHKFQHKLSTKQTTHQPDLCMMFNYGN